MKTTLLRNMYATIVALFISMFALPQQVQSNTVTIDGVEKPILSAEFFAGNGDADAFAAYLYLSADKKEYVRVMGNQKEHAIYYNFIDITRKEPKHDGRWYWSVDYTKNGYGNELFFAYGNPNQDHAVFTNGWMMIFGDPRPTRKICGISLSNGVITDTKHGDGKIHTITIDYKYEGTAPKAGKFTVDNVTDQTISLSWTRGSDETTPQDKLHYTFLYQKKDADGLMMLPLGNVTSHTITGLKPNTEYLVDILIVDESGNSKRYGQQNVTTKQAEDYFISIGGVKINSANYTNISSSGDFPAVKSGKVTYEPSTKTLTLENATIDVAGDENGITTSVNGLSIRLIGENIIKAGGFSAIRINPSSCTIAGNLGEGGSLQLDGKHFGIYTWGAEGEASVTIKDCTVESDGSVGDNNKKYAKVIVKNSLLNVKSKGSYSCIMGLKDLELEQCDIIQPAGATFSPSQYGVTLDGKLVNTIVTIAHLDVSGFTVIDGVKKLILSYETLTDEVKDNFCIRLYLSTDKKELVQLEANTNLHIGKEIDLTTKEGIHDGNYWGMGYATKFDDWFYCHRVFTATGCPGNDIPVCTSGTLRFDGDPFDMFTVRLKGGKINADNTYGDGNPHSFDLIFSNNPTGIDTVTADTPFKKQGIYNLQGMKMNTTFDQLPAGIYIVDGKKVIKK